MVKALAICFVLVLAACGAPSPLPEDPRSVWCEQNQPQRLAEAEIVAASDERLDQVNVHNRKGEAWCGWKPEA